MKLQVASLLFGLSSLVLAKGNKAFLNGADISSLKILENQGITYSSGGNVTAFENILSNHGHNLARIRVWTAGDYDTKYAIALAKRVKKAGMKLLIDLHYSDTWADPSKQFIPSGWPTDLDGLNHKIYNYTIETIGAFHDAGISIDYIQTGNEINDGLLWPVGQISKNGFNGASQLLHSAVKAVRHCSNNTQTMIHVANGWDQSFVNYFYTGILREGALSLDDIDIMGFSFYPFFNNKATLEALNATMHDITPKYKKDVIIDETAWPVLCPEIKVSESSVPVSIAGQETWIARIEEILTSLGTYGRGVLYWEPGWIGLGGLGGACSDALLVDHNGKIRSSLARS